MAEIVQINTDQITVGGKKSKKGLMYYICTSVFIFDSAHGV